jgi:hypothetical protein
VDREEKGIAPLYNLFDRFSARGCPTPENRGDLFVRDKPFGLFGGKLRIGTSVHDNSFYLAAKQATIAVYFFNGQLRGVNQRFFAFRHIAGEGLQDSDPDRHGSAVSGLLPGAPGVKNDACHQDHRKRKAGQKA